MDFHEISYLSTCRKSVEEIQVSLKSDKNKRCFKWSPMNICDKARWIFLRMKNTSDNILEKIKTNILCSKKFCDYRAFYG